jgi:hypothetical protein
MPGARSTYVQQYLFDRSQPNISVRVGLPLATSLHNVIHKAFRSNLVDVPRAVESVLRSIYEFPNIFAYVIDIIGSQLWEHGKRKYS